MRHEIDPISKEEISKIVNTLQAPKPPENSAETSPPPVEPQVDSDWWNEIKASLEVEASKSKLPESIQKNSSVEEVVATLQNVSVIVVDFDTIDTRLTLDWHSIVLLFPLLTFFWFFVL